MMTTNNSIQIFHGEEVETITRPNGRLSKRLVPVRRKSDEAKEATAEQQLTLTCESLKQQLNEITGQLKLARESVVKGNLEFQEFANAVSHDLQAPLRAVSGFSTYLREEYQGELDATADGYLDQIAGGATRMSKLINGVMQFSRVTSKAARFELVDLNHIFEAVVTELQDHIQNAGAVVESCDLPVISGDRNQLTYLMKNLIENGLKFNDSEIPTIRVEARSDGDHRVITVSDNGIGIAPKHLNCVFAIFRCLHAKQKYKGVGAGLAVCRRIANRHLGEVWLESQLGVGTQASIRLPGTTAY